ncbi:32234_t:CDS:10 [Gigaspora margarita]|uniref:32234_t:CDS:1 n=1 Tax=Gigaspora margarita TaxID=4874 RepID=A0ABN7UM51_GIGMA|nr:32234_t:CDS:10 [Gigaspora margarita]
MDFENLVQRYRDTLSSHILTIWQTKRARKNEENKENEEYRENEDLDLQAVDPEVEPLPWGWVCARVAEMLIHTPHGLTEPVILNQLLSEKYRRIRFNRASLSKTASSLTFLHTSNIITMLTPSEEVLIDTLFTDSIADVLPTDIKNGRGYQFWTRGDFLGIHWPYINIEDTYHDEIILHYGDLTVLFCLPMSELCKYMIDYKFHYDRFFIKTLPLRGVNVTLYGKVDDILNNSPLILNNGKQIDRYTIKFSDKTGSQQITLWGKVGREIAEYHIGQYIVLEGLNTWKKSNGELEINGDASSGAMVYNVSMAKGWLAVSSLHSCSLSLATIINHQQIYQFICRCLITGWETNDDSFDINWRLDDGTGVIWAKAVGTVSQDILHSSGIETLTDSLIKTKLKKGHLGTNLIGKMLWCCISILASGKYQINAVLADYSDGSHSIAQADCARMLKEL